MKKIALFVFQDNFDIISDLNSSEFYIDKFLLDNSIEIQKLNINVYDYILIDSKLSNQIKYDILQGSNLFSNALIFSNNNKEIILFSENRFDNIGEYKTKTVGKTGIDTLSHSELDVEKVARIAYEIAEQKNYKITNIDNASSLISSNIWRKVVNDINEDYPSVYLENILIEQFPIKFMANKDSFDILLVDPFYKNIVFNTLLACEYNIKDSIFYNDTNLIGFIFNKSNINNILENIKKITRHKA